MDRTYANPLALPKPAHPKSAKRLTWAEAYILRGGRGSISCGGGIIMARRISDMGGDVVKPARCARNTRTRQTRTRHTGTLNLTAVCGVGWRRTPTESEILAT
jgi:hypothetical protein